ncbi:hypothetical protein ACN469_07300 [Corallococcus terminator]
MKRHLGLLVALGASLLGLGCDGDDGDEPEGPCVSRVTGAVKGSDLCGMPALTYATRHGNFTFSMSTPEGTPVFKALYMEGIGMPSVGTYTGPTREVRCGGLVREGSKDWSPYDLDEVTGKVLEGRCTLTLTKVEVLGTTPNYTTYRFRGTVRAHLLPLESTDATGTVDLEADFVVE